MAKMTLDDLQSQLSGLNAYVPESEDALRARAQSIYDPQYQQDLQSLRDSLTLQLNQQGRSALSNGTQRSSYNNAAQASVRGAGLKAEAQLGAQRDANIANLLNQLMEGEKDRKLAADQNRDNLLLQLFNLGNKGGKGKAASGSPTVDDLQNFANGILSGAANAISSSGIDFNSGLKPLLNSPNVALNPDTTLDNLLSARPTVKTNTTVFDPYKANNTQLKSIYDPVQYSATR